MKKLFLCVGILSLCGCNVESTDKSTGGVDVVGDERCPAGVIAVLGDYMSTQVALLDNDGQALSDSFLSSGSTEASGLAAPLSGDVVPPSSRPDSGEVVLIDRFGTDVITWADPASAEVRTQLPVGTGFSSNPHDYLELSSSKAYVTRYEDNAAPGQQAFDDGGDVLIVDPSQPAIIGNVPLRIDGELPPRPSSLTLLGSTAIVVLQRISLDFAQTDATELVGIDTETDSEIYRVTLQGLKGCGRAMLSPSGKQMALGCSGTLDMDGNLVSADETGIVLLDSSVSPPTEIERISVYDKFGFAPQSELEFASETQVLAKTQTPYFGQGNNQLFALDLPSGEMRVLLEAAANDDGTGKGVVYGGLLCTPSCNSTCLLADADQGLIRRFDAKSDLSELEAVTVGSSSGLSPMGLGPF